jgi:uncharacterized membrane protein (DUF106 family)
MWIFNSLFGKIFDLLFLPFRGLSPWYGMIFVSLLTGLFMLFVFRTASNQEGIRKVKNRIKAHLLELRLYKDSFATSLKAQGSIMRCNLRYISYSARPMLVMIIPLALIIIQLSLWFNYQSLTPGDDVILKIILKDGYDPLDTQMVVQPSSGFALETPPLRIEETREIDWRLRAEEPGHHDLVLSLDGVQFQKTFAVDQKALSKISAARVGKNVLSQIINPGEPPLPADSPIKDIKILYPTTSMNFFGWGIHWLIVYFILAIIFGFALKGVLRVEI